MLSRLRQRLLMQLFIVYLRYLIGAAFVFASLIKIKGHRFTTEDGTAAPMHSAWHFFETMYQSGLYWQFIGVGQLLAGLLLMTQRYARLGALLFLPIIANIFVITLSFDFAYTPVITGLMLLANLLLVWWEWPVLRVLLNQEPSALPATQLGPSDTWELTGLVLFLFTFGYRALYDQYNILLWAGICLLLGLLGLVIGLKRRQVTRASRAQEGYLVD
jgi:LPXTG-motif cell wall-anchored protein